jgi:hypothetical protein
VRIVLILSGGVTGNEFKSKVFVASGAVALGRMRPRGHHFLPDVFSLVRCRSLEQCFAQVAITRKRMRAEHLAMPLVAAGCEFKHPARAGRPGRSALAHLRAGAANRS